MTTPSSLLRLLCNQKFMKKWVLWLSIVLVAMLVSGSGVWWVLSNIQHKLEVNIIPTSEIGKANKVKSQTTNVAKRKSPTLGKEIPGLPEFCADKLISVSGCNGQAEITTDQGNTYKLVEIGDQCWFADNLKEIPDVDTGWYGYYDNAKDEPSPGEGMLYTWDAAMNGEIKERAQGICPSGWHVPSDCEWMSLEVQFAIKNSELLALDWRETDTKRPLPWKVYPGIWSNSSQYFPFTGRKVFSSIWTSSHEGSSQKPIIRNFGKFANGKAILRFKNTVLDGLTTVCLKS